MSRRTELIIILLLVLVICSVGSHLAARKLNLLTKAGGPMHFGEKSAQVKAIAAGSSLTFYGIAWSDVAKTLNAQMVGLACPGASVSELEVMQREAPPDARYTFLGISAYDINENHASDYHAEIVPVTEEISRLWAADASWTQTKKALSQYPVYYTRFVFPTAGRSGPVMVKTREVLRGWMGRTPAQAPAPSEGAVITDKGNSRVDTITSWPDSRMHRNLADIRVHSGSTFDFQSTKRQALFAFLRRGTAQGRMIVVVMPESPLYQSEILGRDGKERFEALIREAQKEVPEAVWVRLDRVPELNSNQYYWDLIHLNAYGQEIATRTLVAQLAAAGVVAQ